MAHTAIRRTMASLLTRTLSSSTSSRSRFVLPLLDKNLLLLSHHNLVPDPLRVPTRFKTSGPGYSPLNDPSPNWSNRPPKETIMLDGCDYEHWLIVMEFPDDNKPAEEGMIDAYVKTLAAVVGSEEEAKKKIYSVCTTTYTGFGALISEELSYKVKEQPGVLWVLPDSYLDVPSKDYGGDLFVDGKVIHRPQYTYVNRQTNNRNRPRPRYDRRRESRPVEGIKPLQSSWNQDQNPPVQQPASMGNQNPAQHQGTGTGAGFSMNQGQFNQNPVQQQGTATGFPMNQGQFNQNPAHHQGTGTGTETGFPMNQGQYDQNPGQHQGTETGFPMNQGQFNQNRA